MGSTGEHEALAREDADRFLEELEAFGYGPEALAKARAEAERLRPRPAGFLVHPDNERAVRLFLALQTQWRVVALSTMARAEIRATGLDYAVLGPVARMEGLGRVKPDDFGRLRVMEAEALLAWRRERERAS